MPSPARGIERSEKADKRDAILRAATEVFAQRGFFNAQVADVARAAGVAAGTVYLYFRSKDDVLVSIFERTMREAIEAGREAIATVEDPIERLRVIARVHLERLGHDRALAVVFQVELRQSTKFMERFSATALREYLGLIRGVVVEGQAKGVIRRQVNATLAAKLFFGALDEMATNWILSRRKYALAAESDAIVDILVRGMGSDPAARTDGVRPRSPRDTRDRGAHGAPAKQRSGAKGSPRATEPRFGAEPRRR